MTEMEKESERHGETEAWSWKELWKSWRGRRSFLCCGFGLLCGLVVRDVKVKGGSVGRKRRIGIHGSILGVASGWFVVAMTLRDGHVFDARRLFVDLSREQSEHSSRPTY